MKFYWYPKCSTCQKAKQYLDNLGKQVEVIDIVINNPSTSEIKEYHKLSKLPIERLFNTSGLVYKELDLKNKMSSLSLEDKYKLLASNGKLIKRPILVLDSIALFGFKQNEWDNNIK